MRILVTGGAGFIGSAVCRHLIQETNAEVVNVDKLTYAGNPNSLKMIGANPVFVDVERSTLCLDIKLAEQALSKKTKAVMLVDSSPSSWAPAPVPV